MASPSVPPPRLSFPLSLTHLSLPRRSSSRARAPAPAVDRELQLAGAAPGSNPARYGPLLDLGFPVLAPSCLIVVASPFTMPHPGSTVQVPAPAHVATTIDLLCQMTSSSTRLGQVTSPLPALPSVLSFSNISASCLKFSPAMALQLPPQRCFVHSCLRQIRPPRRVARWIHAAGPSPE